MANIDGFQTAVVGVTTGPEWANITNINFNLLDSHDHSAGKGAQINLSSCIINANLPMAGFSILNANHLQLSDSGASPTSDVRSVYVSSGDLFYKNGSGTAVRITSGSNVAGSAGSIIGLTGDATVSYTSPSFTFKSTATAPANVSVGYVNFHNPGNMTYGHILQAPTLSTNLTQTLPATPTVAGTYFMLMNQAGVMSTQLKVETAQITDLAVTTAKIADSNVTTAKINNSAVTTAKIADSAVTAAKIVPNVALFGNAKIDLGGIGVTTRYIVSTAYANTSPLGVMCGVINDGAIVTGEGFTCSKIQTGVYDITLSAFSTYPSVVGTAYGGYGPSYGDAKNFNVYSITGSSENWVVRVVITDGATNVSNGVFSFIVMGIR